MKINTDVCSSPLNVQDTRFSIRSFAKSLIEKITNVAFNIFNWIKNLFSFGSTQTKEPSPTLSKNPTKLVKIKPIISTFLEENPPSLGLPKSPNEKVETKPLDPSFLKKDLSSSNLTPPPLDPPKIKAEKISKPTEIMSLDQQFMKHRKFIGFTILTITLLATWWIFSATPSENALPLSRQIFIDPSPTYPSHNFEMCSERFQNPFSHPFSLIPQQLEKYQCLANETEPINATEIFSNTAQYITENKNRNFFSFVPAKPELSSVLDSKEMCPAISTATENFTEIANDVCLIGKECFSNVRTVPKKSLQSSYSMNLKILHYGVCLLSVFSIAYIAKKNASIFFNNFKQKKDPITSDSPSKTDHPSNNKNLNNSLETINNNTAQQNNHDQKLPTTDQNTPYPLRRQSSNKIRRRITPSSLIEPPSPQRTRDIIQTEETYPHPVHKSVIENNENALIQLIERKHDLNEFDGKGYRPLHLSCICDLEKIGRILIMHGAKINPGRDVENFSVLHVACSEEKELFFNMLMEFNPNLEERDKKKRTPLHKASKNSNKHIFQTLINKNANVHAKDHLGNTPLHIACKNGHLEHVKLLLLNIAKVNATNDRDETPLHLACEQGHLPIVDILLNHQANIHLKNTSQQTPLHSACIPSKKNQNENNKVFIIDKLLKKKANIDAVDSDQDTPISIACLYNQTEIVKSLLKNGAKIDTFNYVNNSPLHIAIAKENIEIVKAFLNKKKKIHLTILGKSNIEGNTPLHLACKKRNSEIVALLLKYRVSGNCSNIKGETPLHSILSLSQETQTERQKTTTIVNTLLEKKVVNLQAQNINGLTPLHLACKSNNAQITETLIKKGSDIQAKTIAKLSPLHFSACFNSMENAKCLLNHNAKLEDTDQWGRTPLHLASINGNLEVLKFLIEKNAKIEAKDHKGKTPLHWAALKENKESINELLNHNANPNSTDRNGKTPLHIAAKHGNADAINLLCAYGSDTESQDKNKQTPFQLALKYKHTQAGFALLFNKAKPA